MLRYAALLGVTAALWAQQWEIPILDRAPLVGGKQDTVVTIVCPPADVLVEQVVLSYALHRPPGGWDPWDRIAYVNVLTEQDTFEIARIMTPYSRECGWEIDVTPFRPLLTDTVRIRAFILYWASGPQGYLVSLRLRFVPGQPELVPYRVVRLWANDALRRWPYGNPKDPIEQYVPPRRLFIEDSALAVHFWALLTGHGQGNTDNAAEFSQKTHAVVVNGEEYPRLLWRNDCAQNPCRPQAGTWQYNRAGWCPGDYVRPWEEDITASVRRGDSNTIAFRFQPYINYCSPWWDSCVSGITCPDCNFNSTGHTMPWYMMSAYAVLYRRAAGQSVGEHRGAVPVEFVQDQYGIVLRRRGSASVWQWALVNLLGQVLRSGEWHGESLRIPLQQCAAGVYAVLLKTPQQQVHVVPWVP
jgi:hypothetical protein